VIPKRNIALIGFMAAGKTSVGLALSALTRIPFVDVDLCIEEAEGMSVAEIFAAKGEPYFREAEGAVFRRLCEGSGRIIGCGGGTLIDPRNRAALVDGCRTVWLRVSAEDVLNRIARPDAPVRPLVEGAPRLIVPKLLQTRESLYGIADLTIETAGRGIDEIAQEIRFSLCLPPAGEG
jgi:shikimate kinase